MNAHMVGQRQCECLVAVPVPIPIHAHFASIPGGCASAERLSQWSLPGTSSLHAACGASITADGCDHKGSSSSWNEVTARVPMTTHGVQLLVRREFRRVISKVSQAHSASQSVLPSILPLLLPLLHLHIEAVCSNIQLNFPLLISAISLLVLNFQETA